jgi:hypothetical protein
MRKCKQKVSGAEKVAPTVHRNPLIFLGKSRSGRCGEMTQMPVSRRLGSALAGRWCAILDELLLNNYGLQKGFFGAAEDPVTLTKQTEICPCERIRVNSEPPPSASRPPLPGALSTVILTDCLTRSSPTGRCIVRPFDRAKNVHLQDATRFAKQNPQLNRQFI